MDSVLKIFSTLTFLFIWTALNIAAPNDIFKENSNIDSSEYKNLYLDFQSFSYFKNNEYFGALKQGMTITGIMIQPSLKYYAGKNTSVSFGLHLNRFHSYKNNYNIEATFRINHKFTDEFSFIMGNIYGPLEHNLIEPLYSFDRLFFDNREKGLEFIFNNDRIRSDLWLNWESFILWNDPFQEKFTAGTSNNLKVVKNESLTASLIFQSLISHRGGQINSTDTSIQSLGNFSPGIKLTKHFNKSADLEFFFHVPLYSQFSGDDGTPYNEGTGYYQGSSFTFKGFFLELSYWYCDGFYGQRGEELYSSFSPLGSIGFKEKFRNLQITKFRYTKNYNSGISFSTGLEGYYDVKNENFDYNYALYLIFNEDFFLKTIK